MRASISSTKPLKQNFVTRSAGAVCRVLWCFKVTVVRASLPPTTDLNRYFEIMNTRGQQLLQVDIVKARLMSAAGCRACRFCLDLGCLCRHGHLRTNVIGPGRYRLAQHDLWR